MYAGEKILDLVSMIQELEITRKGRKIGGGIGI